MKTTSTKKIRFRLPTLMRVTWLCAITCSLSGCGTDALYTAGAAAATGTAGSILGKGNPLITGISAAGGALASEFVQGQIKNSKESARQEGYNLGRSDAVKQQYWVTQNEQKQSRVPEVRASYLPITVGGGKNAAGIVSVPQTYYLRVEE